MDWMNSLFLLCGALLFLSVVSTTLSARLGMPLLLVFLAVGMLAGEDGIGRVDFDNFVQANVISQLALAVILLDGGLRTRPESFRIALKPSAVLATWGVFATVLLLIQGTTIPVMARWLKVAVPPKPEPKDTRDIWLAERESVRLTAYRVAADSEAEGMHPDKVAPISSSFELRCFALIRGGGRIALHGDTALQAGDTAWYILPEEQVDNMARYFTETGSSMRMNFNFFGEFIVDPAGRAGDLAQAYGLRLNDGEESLSLYELFEMRADSKYPVEGDRIEIGGFMLIVKELDKNGTIKWLGLKCPQ